MKHMFASARWSRILRKFIVMVSVVMVVACEPQAHLSIKNDCSGVWFRISKMEGPGNVTVYKDPLMPGDRIFIPLTGTAGQDNRFVIMADGFEIGTNASLGTAERDLYVHDERGPTASEHNYSWEISHLFPGGCERERW